MQAKIITFCVLTLAISSACTWQQEDEVYPTSTPSMLLADEDKDGFISRREAQKHPSISSIFDELDTDGDDRISEEEYR